MSKATMHLQPELIETLRHTIMQVVKDENDDDKNSSVKSSIK